MLHRSQLFMLYKIHGVGVHCTRCTEVGGGSIVHATQDTSTLHRTLEVGGVIDTGGGGFNKVGVHCVRYTGRGSVVHATPETIHLFNLSKTLDAFLPHEAPDVTEFHILYHPTS